MIFDEYLAIRPRHAFRAMSALLQNPDDTSQVFLIIEALSGRTPVRLTHRFRRLPGGAELLAERPELLRILEDTDKLEAMPDGSLARAYLAFLNREAITARGLIDASEVRKLQNFEDGSDERFVDERLRDSHDLWHAVTGYHGDLIGEASLLAFTLAQTRNPGVAFIVAMALLKAGDLQTRRLILDGFRRGLRATWLPAVRWESLLPLPLDEVRQRLSIDAPAQYEPFRSSELEQGGLTFGASLGGNRRGGESRAPS